MKNTIIIAIEMVNTCNGLGAKFWKGKKVIAETDLKHVLDRMNTITAEYNNFEHKAVAFTTK